MENVNTTTCDFASFKTKSSEFVEFESIIEESEAEGELSKLVSSDDEFFIDFETCDGQGDQRLAHTSRAPPQPTTPTCSSNNASASDTQALKCIKCHRVYKRRHYLQKHQTTCAGTGRKFFKKSAAEYSEDG